MNISVNIPSYKRPKVKTLKYLPFAKVWVDESEVDEYRAENPNAEIIACPKGVQGNIARVRNYILDTEFARGVDVVLMLDDDLKGVFLWAGEKEMPYKPFLIDADMFLDWVDKYSQLCNDMGFKMWGCNCNQDKQSYKQTTPFSLSAFCGGPFQCILKNDLRYDERIPLKEDYDMVIQQCNKYRGVLRLNFAFYVCNQSNDAGGCASIRNREKEREQFNLLKSKWGGQIVKRDRTLRNMRCKKQRLEDYNPIIRIPIK